MGALRFDATDDGLRTSTGLPQGDISVCFWAYLSVDNNTFTNFWSIENAETNSTQYITITTDIDGTTLKVWNHAATAIGAYAMTVGTWHKIAFVLAGTTGIFYAGPATGPMTEQARTTFGAVTRSWMFLGTDSFGEWLNGRIHSPKVWDVPLTIGELNAEMRQTVPRRTANINRWHPFVAAGSATKDYSGNGRDLTAGAGATTTEDGPPIPWRVASRILPVRPASAAGNATVTPVTIACATSVPQASVNAAAGPSVVAATTAVPQPAINVAASPAVIATTVSLPSVGVNVQAGPAVITATTEVAQPSVNVAAGPTVLPMTVALPQATPQTGGNATAQPSAITCIITIPQPGINTTAGPSAVAATVALPSSGAGVTAGPSTLATTTTLPSSGASAGAGPATVATTATLLIPGLNVGAGPSVIPVTVSLATPSTGATVKATSASTVTAPNTSTSTVTDTPPTSTPTVAAATSSTSTVT